MKTNRIDPSHIWDIRDKNLDVTSKALLVRLAGLQHLEEIWVSNATLAADLGVSRRTIVEKMKVLAGAGYIAERREVHEPTQTKITEISREFVIEKILGSTKGARLATLRKHYGMSRETKEKMPLQTTPKHVSHIETLDDSASALENIETYILS